jgi:hypothetical protein
MADAIDKDVPANGTADAADTSTQDEEKDLTQAFDDEVSFENEADNEPDTEDESVEEATDTEEAEEESTEEDDTEEPDETQDESEQQPAATDKPSDNDAEDKHKANQEAAKRRVAEREARDKAKTEAQQKYLDEAEDNRDLALRQLQIDAYNNKVENNTSKLTNGIDKALANIDLFTKGTPAVQNRLLRALDMFEQTNVVKDENGDPIEVKGDVYQYLQEEADSIKELLGDGARQQEKSKQNQKSRTLTTPVKAPVKPKKDPMLDGFDEEVAKGW